MSGHGHVFKNADESVARCGGPALCSRCAKDFYCANYITLQAADALAKAAKDAHNNLLYSAPLKPHVAATQRAEKLLRNALATYEKVRNSK